MMVWPRKPEVIVQGRLFSRGILWGPPRLSHAGSVAGPDTGSRALEPPDSVFVSISPPVHGQDSGSPSPGGLVVRILGIHCHGPGSITGR